MIDFPSNPAIGQSFNSLTGGIYTWDGMAWSLVNSGFDRWATRGIGEIYMVNTALAGVDIPPATTAATVWIELTAGLTGAGAFNNGKLTSESVTGSAPLVVATAVVNLTGSPMNGQTIRHLNTEGRILRPSTSSGALQDDALQDHSHAMRYSDLSGSVGGSDVTRFNSANNIWGAGSVGNVNGFINSRVASETRMRNMGIKTYMRIK